MEHECNASHYFKDPIHQLIPCANIQRKAVKYSYAMTIVGEVSFLHDEHVRSWEIMKKEKNFSRRHRDLMQHEFILQMKHKKVSSTRLHDSIGCD